MIFLKQNSQKLGGDLKKSFFFFVLFGNVVEQLLAY